MRACLAGLLRRLLGPDGDAVTPAVIALVGAPGSGKSHFATERYPWYQILSSDRFREQLTDSSLTQDINPLIFDALHSFLRVRCSRGLTTVVDATNGEQAHRTALITIAREYGHAAIAVHVDMPLYVCHWRNDARPAATKVPPDAVDRIWKSISEADLPAEFDAVRHLGLDDRHDPFDHFLGEIPPGQETGAWTR